MDQNVYIQALSTVIAALIGAAAPILVELVKDWISKENEKEKGGILVPGGYKSHKPKLNFNWSWIFVGALLGAGFGYGLGRSFYSSEMQDQIATQTTIPTQSGGDQIMGDGNNANTIIQSQGDVIINNNGEPTLTPLPPDWKPIHVYGHETICTTRFVYLPEQLVPSINQTLNFKDLETYIFQEKESPPKWLFPFFGEEMTYTLSAENVGPGIEWIRVDGSIVVKIEVVPNPFTLENVNVGYTFNGCGGIENRHFPPVILDSKDPGYTLIQKALDYSAFSLQPGEFEDFLFDFRCMSPGTYQVSFEVLYTYKGETQAASVDAPVHFVCPSSYAIWEVDSDNTYRYPFELANSRYSAATIPVQIGDTYIISQPDDQSVSCGEHAENPMSIWESPPTSGTIIRNLTFCETITIVDGPVFENGINWWKINDENNVEGWITEDLVRFKYVRRY